MTEDIWPESDLCDFVSQVITDSPFTERNREYQARRDIIHRRKPPRIPGVTVDAQGKPTGALAFQSFQAAKDGNAFKNTMLGSRIKINTAALKEGPRAEQAARRQEAFFYRHYYRWRDQRIFDGALFDMATLGIGELRVSLNNDLLPDTPEYKDGMKASEFLEMADDALKQFASGEKRDLFVLESLRPETVYRPPHTNVVVYAATLPRNALAQFYGKRGKKIIYDDQHNAVEVAELGKGEAINTSITNWTKTVTMYVVENDDFCYHMLLNPRIGDISQRGSLLAVYKNYFGKPAFEPVVAEETGDPHPLHAHLPLIDGMYEVIPFQNAMLTIMAQAGIDASQQRYTPRWTLTGQQPQSDPAELVFKIDENGVIKPNEHGWVLENAGLALGPDVPKALQTINSFDTGGYPKTLSRPEEVSAQSGYDRAQAQDAVANLLNPPLGHFGSALSAIFSKMGHAVHEIGVPITVRNVQTRPRAAEPQDVTQEVTLSPADLEDDTDTKVTFSAISIFTRIAMQEEALKVMQADQMTETQMQMDVMGTDDVEAWRDQRTLDKVLKAADDKAVMDVMKTIERVSAAFEEQALAQNTPQIAQAMNEPAPPMLQTNGEMLRSDRGPGIPVGPGQAIPAVPPPPPGMQQMEMEPVGGLG